MLDSFPSIYHPEMSGVLEIANLYHELGFRIYYYNEMKNKAVEFAEKEAIMPGASTKASTSGAGRKLSHASTPLAKGS